MFLGQFREERSNVGLRHSLKILWMHIIGRAIVLAYRLDSVAELNQGQAASDSLRNSSNH
jgi:hypothetical protein